MERRLHTLLIAVVVLTNAAATILYSGVGPTVPEAKALDTRWNPALEFLSDVLTLPISTAGITDVRDVALLVGLCLMLLIAAAACLSGRKAETGDWAVDRVTGALLAPRYSPAEVGLAVCALAVSVLALSSAAFNGIFDMSCGWIVRFVSGACWALLIARIFTPGMTRRALLALLILGGCCLVLTVADRADRDLAHFRWPIGPITITAALAAVWAAVAGSWAVGGMIFRRGGFRAGILVLICLLAAYVLQQTGRRGPALGLVAAVGVTGALHLWSRYRRPVVKVCILGSPIVAIVLTAVYVTGQLRSSEREVSGPLALRLAYWGLSGGLIADRPLIGSGPGTFILEMTNTVAPLRAESPHFYHGGSDSRAHNEWIQAAVELGLPGALAYLALPLSVMLFAVGRFLGGTVPDGKEKRQAEPHLAERDRRVMIVALVAGLTAIVATDCASITLRDPMMPVWYWTLLGLLAALCSESRCEESDARLVRAVPRALPVGLSLLAVAFITFAAVDVRRAVAQDRKELGAGGLWASRLYADKMPYLRYEAAVLASRRAHADPGPRQIATATAFCRDLYRTSPGFHDVPARYADILLLGKRQAAARAVLENALSDRLNPYSVSANKLYAGLLTDDAVGRLRCVQRALRAGVLERLHEILVALADEPAVLELLERELPNARTAATGSSEVPPCAPTVELLRISAFLKERAGRAGEAIAEQRLAAHCYRRLEREQDPCRRTDAAETDAFFTLARMLYDADPANYREAYEAVVEAERYAVLGIRHERVADPQPERGFLGGEVLPMESPRRLQPLWRFSALLHVIAGNEHFLMARVKGSLGPAMWGDRAAITRELARVYRRAYEDMRSLAAEDRPAHFPHLREMALDLAPAAPLPDGP